MELPKNVLDALHRGQKIRAIKLLRAQRGIGLKEAKDIVDAYLANHDIRRHAPQKAVSKNGEKSKFRGLCIALIVIAAFVWAFIHLVEVAGSAIVLWHHDGYREATFVISKVHYRDDSEAGLTWGFVGNLVGDEKEMRMYAPKLSDAKALGHQKLRNMYPPGMQLKVWYNPDVTAVLFQRRTLQIIPYTPDLVKSEQAVIYRWLLYCLLPLAGAMLFASVMKQS